jgi:hypothetical protein
MTTAKKFDCVLVKDQIQGRLRKRWQGLTEEQVRAEVREHLATSRGEIAKWWRAIETARRKA